jgi:hypothetical protein
MATSLGNCLKRVKPNLKNQKNKKIKDGNPCIYLFILLLSPFLNVSGEISPTPGLEGTLR